jgi:cation diffusion facilitator CzcD-associated flavoprotein CzcO
MTGREDVTTQEPEHLDVLIVGAGISGIDAGYHLLRDRPETRFAILEAKHDIGGTWHTHRFPGIRSDSDLFTFGFSWKPWTGVPIATASEILKYLNAAVDEQGIRDLIRFDQQIDSADWSEADQCWTVTIRKGPDAEVVTLTCGFLWMCAGYYRHAQGYTPEWPGKETFAGEVVHPQNWPEELDHAGKHVIVIGSGATAATLIPALAKSAASVTMLQRSPTYYFPRPIMDDFNTTLSKLGLPDEQYHDIMRRKFLHDSETVAKRAREEPDVLAEELIGGVRQYLGDDAVVKEHFTPTYRPWRQRIAMLPDGDLFVALREGRAEIVTNQIECFTENGLRLKNGEELEADIIVTATGLTLNMFGDISISLDGEPYDLSDAITHRGTMFTGLPNVATVFGYLRSSWTLRADLISNYIIRLLDHMDRQGAASVMPMLRNQDQGMAKRSWIDPDNFNPGYIARALDQLPQQGDKQPWIMTQDFFQDRLDLPVADLDDGTLVYR